LDLREGGRRDDNKKKSNECRKLGHISPLSMKRTENYIVDVRHKRGNFGERDNLLVRRKESAN
jgi:hypothetical protein